MKNIFASSRNVGLLLSPGELNGKLYSENRETYENRILRVWVQPRFPLASFMLEKPRNARFRTVSELLKTMKPFLLPDGGEIIDGSGC